VLGAQRACAAVFPKGVLARAPGSFVHNGGSRPGRALRAPGEDDVAAFGSARASHAFAAVDPRSRVTRRNDCEPSISKI
jgi:hypothetical protein